MNKQATIANIRNEVALHASIGFKKAKELCLFLVLVGQVNPLDEKEEMSGLISVQDMIKLIKTDNAKRSGSMYERIVDFLADMKKGNYMDFPSNVLFGGKPLPKTVTIFDTLEPVEIPEGNKMYRFEFNEKMRPYIVGFKKEFVQLTIPAGMKSGYAVRFFVLAKAYYDRRKMHTKTVVMPIQLDELKRILGIEGKYSAFKDFRKRVLHQIQTDINQMDVLHIKDMKFRRSGRKITHIDFCIESGKLGKEETASIVQINTSIEADTGNRKKESNDFIPNETDIALLTHSQLLAYKYLVQRHVFEGIVYRQIIKKVPSSEYLGWEDVFVQKAWEHFENTTKYKEPVHKAGAFVKWWQNGEFKDKLFPKIMEEVISVKKQKSPEDILNRNAAKTKTAAEFEEWYKQGKGNKANKKESGIKKSNNLLQIKSVEIKKIDQQNILKLPFVFSQWKKQNPKVYKKIKHEQVEKFEAYKKTVEVDIVNEKQILNNLIEQQAKAYYEKHL